MRLKNGAIVGMIEILTRTVELLQFFGLDLRRLGRELRDFRDVAVADLAAGGGMNDDAGIR